MYALLSGLSPKSWGADANEIGHFLEGSRRDISQHLYVQTCLHYPRCEENRLFWYLNRKFAPQGVVSCVLFVRETPAI